MTGMDDKTLLRDEILVGVLGFLVVPVVVFAIAAAWVWEPLAFGH